MSEQTTSKQNPWMISTLMLVGMIIGFGIAQISYFDFGGESVSRPTPSSAQPPAQREVPLVELTKEQTAVLPDDDMVIGDKDAEITIVEFSDFQCSYCARFAATTLPLIKENYIDTGKVKLIYRDFPIEDKHPQASQAAQSAECAREGNKFQEMHDVLFAKQAEWSGSPTAVDMFKGYAGELGLNQGRFDKCLDGGKYVMEVRKDLIDGAAVGINGTPGFFVNGKLVSGAMPYNEVFKLILDAELNGDDWKMMEDSTGRISIEVL